MGTYPAFETFGNSWNLHLNYILLKDLISLKRSLILVLVCIGIAIATFNDLELRIYGLVVALIFVPVAAVYKVQFKRVLKDYDMLSLLHRVYPPAIFVMCILSLLLDPPGLSQPINLPLEKLHKFVQLGFWHVAFLFLVFTSLTFLVL